MPALHELTAAELSAAFARRELSPVEVTDAVLSRVEACEPRINAMYLVHRDTARASAREAERRWRAGQPLSPIDGVPITIKENLYTRGDPAPIGTAATPLTPKTADAPPAARAREAGCVLIGKTTMPDFGMLSSGLSSVHGVTRNPWRLDRNPSGSSSGAGAAAAAGYGPLHLGTDIGGSVRLPATHNGVFALKPSLGRIPIDPPYIGRVAGPMTRTVRDSAMLLSVLSRPDDRDFMNLPPRPLDYAGELDGLSPNGLRIGLLADAGLGLPVHPEVAAAVRGAARALADAGASVEPMAPFLSAEMFDGWCMFFEARSYNDLIAMDDVTRAKVVPFIVEWCTWRARDFTGAHVMAAYTAIQTMRQVTVAATSRYDFVLSPTSPIPPYEAELPSPNNDPHEALPHIAFTMPFNMSEQPAASVNWGFTADGLPLGVQIVGRRFDDLGVMRLSRVIEQLRPAQRPWPNP